MGKNSSNSSMEFLGNTETKNSKSKAQKSGVVKYCFTLNNYTIEETNEIPIVLSNLCKKYIYQSEVGENGTPHLQGGIWLKKSTRITELKKIKCISRAHFEPMKDEIGTISYCQKNDTADGKIKMSFGFPKPIKIIENLHPWQTKVEKMLLSEPDGRTINWIWEPIGAVGKSAFCKYMFVKHNALVIQGGKLADIMNIIFNTNMDTCSIVIIDVPRNNGNNVSYNAIECILNGMITNTKYETGAKVFNPPNVLVFSNYAPDTDKLSADRWNIKKIDEKKELI